MICLISGGDSGIGLALSKSLEKSGHEVISFSRTGRIKADVTSNKDAKRIVVSTLKKFGRIDVLINTAGIFGPFGEFEKIPLKKHLQPLAVNLIGTMRLSHLVIPYMKKQKFGRIINFSGGGVGGDTIPVNASSYFISKGAISFFTEVLADEVKDFGITVNAVLPGQILTKSTKKTLKLSKKFLGPVLWEATKNLKKTGTESAEPVINLIKFLISDKADHITGKLLSAKWDNIRDLMNIERKDKISKYTLRRIEGKIYVKKI